MNVITLILMGFCLIGVLDKILRRWNLAQAFDRGLHASAEILVPYIGICIIGGLIVDYLTVGLERSAAYLPPVLVGFLMPPDLGGLNLSEKLSAEPTWGWFCGLIISGCIGQFVNFQLPVLKTAFEKNNAVRPNFYRGFVCGVAAAPIGLLLGAIVLGIPFGRFIMYCMPILCMCLVIALGLVKAPDLLVMILEKIATALAAVSTCFFGAAAFLLFVRPDLVMEPLRGCMVSFVNLIVIVSGSTVLVELLTRHTNQEKLERVLKLDSATIVGMMLNSISTLTMLTMFDKMSKKGQQMNSAFAVCGAYTFGGELAFAASTGSSRAVSAFIIAKLGAAFAAVFIVYLLNRGREVA